MQPKSKIQNPKSKIAIAMVALAGLLWSVPKIVEACMGSPPQIVCAKSTVLAKVVPVVTVGPGTATVSGIVIVRAFSSLVPPPAGCVPVSTTVSVSAVCVPTPPGPPMGAVTFATPSPGTYTFVVPVPIPFPGFSSCTVHGTAATTWGDGSVTIASGDTVLCIAEEAPGQPGVPRLDMELLTPPVQAAHPGDQRVHTFKITNNDPTESATLTLSGDSEQAARLPMAVPPPPPGSGTGVFAISDPTPTTAGGGDNFPIQFLEDLLPTPVGPPIYVIDDGSSENQIGVTGGGSIIWLNQFTSMPGNRIIDRIDVILGPVGDGKPISVLLYRDPNNDGNPNDAVLLTRADALTSGGGTGAIVETKIHPTDVGPVGSQFFVGVVMQEQAAGEFPAALDQSSNAMRSWIAAGDACEGNVITLSANDVPPTPVGMIGFPGNWMVRAHSSAAPPAPPCIVLPDDPLGFPVPMISRNLFLCPGESREISIVTRSWPMCANGSCSEQRVVVTGTFSDGSPTGACLGVSMLADTSVPPQFQWADSGRMGTVTLQGPDGLRIDAQMPTHIVREGVRIQNLQVQTGQPVQMIVQSQLLDPERGRIVAHNVGTQGPAAFPGQPFTVSGVMQIFSKQPPIQTELVALHLHSASPILNDSYFSVNARTHVTGPGIPPTLDSFFDVFYQVSLDGVTDGLHRAGRILPSSVNLQILSPTQLGFSFAGVFPPGQDFTAAIQDVSVVFDPGGVATGVPISQPLPPCPADITGSGQGVVNVDDLLLVIQQWGACPPPCPPHCAADITRNCVVNVDDLLAVISAWGPCP